MKTLAAILIEQRQPLVLDELEIPPLQYGQVLVKLIFSGICGSQLGEIDGVKGPDRFLPHLLGHEGAGEILECGAGVRHVSAGDRVVLHWRPGFGIEAPPAQYVSGKLGRVNAGWVTTFSRHAVVSGNRVTKVPADFDPVVAALLGCAVLTGFGVVNNDARLRIGESIVVLGAGGIGLNIVQAAALVAAYPIIAVERYANRLELAGKMGATHLINSNDGATAAKIRQILGEAGADVVVENTGNVSLIEMAVELTAAAGRTVLVGVPPVGQKPRIYTLPLHFEKRLTGSHGGSAQPARDIPRYVRLCQAGRLRLGEAVERRYALEQINQAIADMRSGIAAGRCLLEM